MTREAQKATDKNRKAERKDKQQFQGFKDAQKIADESNASFGFRVRADLRGIR